MADRFRLPSYLPAMLRSLWNPPEQQMVNEDQQLEQEDELQSAVDQQIQHDLQMAVYRQLEQELQEERELQQEREIQMAVDRQLEQELQMAVYRQLEEELQKTRIMTRESSIRGDSAAGPSSASAAAASTKTQPVSKETISGKYTPTVSCVRALCDFLPSEPGKLQFRKGDIIFVLDHVSKEWWKGSLHGRTGIFPLKCVELLPDSTPEDLQQEAEMEAKLFGQMGEVEKLLTLLNTNSSELIKPQEVEEITNLEEMCSSNCMRGSPRRAVTTRRFSRHPRLALSRVMALPLPVRSGTRLDRRCLCSMILRKTMVHDRNLNGPLAGFNRDWILIRNSSLTRSQTISPCSPMKITSRRRRLRRSRRRRCYPGIRNPSRDASQAHSGRQDSDQLSHED